MSDIDHKILLNGVWNIYKVESQEQEQAIISRGSICEGLWLQVGETE